VVYAATREATVAPVIGSVGVLGGVMLAFVLVRGHDDLLGWALAVAGIAYTLAIVVHGTHVDETAPLIGAGLLLCGELATWSLDERWRIAADRGLTLARAAAVAALGLAGLAAGALVVSLAAAPVGRGLGWTVLGAVAAVAAVGVSVRLSRR
jgi:hypothetical protein